MRIILNADDFGHSEDTVEATISLFERGLLTSATIMSSMPASAAAFAFARDRPDISFGVHLVFVGDGVERSASPPGRIPALAHPDGRFRPARTTRVKALAGLLSVDEIARELSAQISLVADAGIAITHVDSHKHLHKLPSFHAAARRALPSHGISRVRTVQDVYLDRPLFNLTTWVGGYWRRRLKRDFDSTDHFYMPTTAGDADWYRVASRLGGLSGDTIEVGIHPGSAEEWRRLEQESLPRFVDAVNAAGHELVSWRAVEPRPH